jgi:ABC-type bacteriocin/lantibiotic exporter with double-glycine peptidase domain
MYEEKANIIVLILFLSQLFILGLYQIIINICAWLIRQKLIERSIHETLNSNPMISDFNTVINKCVIEFKSIKEKEAKRVLRQLLNSNTKIAEKIRK